MDKIIVKKYKEQYPQERDMLMVLMDLTWSDGSKSIELVSLPYEEAACRVILNGTLCQDILADYDHECYEPGDLLYTAFEAMIDLCTSEGGWLADTKWEDDVKALAATGVGYWLY